MLDDEVVVRMSRRQQAAYGRVGGLTTASRHDMREVARRAREGLAAKFLREAEGDPARADVLRRLYFARLTAASVAARVKRKVVG